MPCCAMRGRSTTRCACSPSSATPCSPPRRRAAIRWKRWKPRSDGSASPAAWRRRAGWCARTRPTCPRLQPAPGRCCTGSGRSSWRLPLSCAPGRGRHAARRGDAPRHLPGRRQDLAAQPAGRFPQIQLARCGAGRGDCRPADLGSRDIAGVARPAARRRHLGRGQPAMAGDRGSAHRARPVRRACARRARCRSPCRTPRTAGSKNAAPCSTRRLAEVAGRAACGCASRTCGSRPAP